MPLSKEITQPIQEYKENFEKNIGNSIPLDLRMIKVSDLNGKFSEELHNAVFFGEPVLPNNLHIKFSNVASQFLKKKQSQGDQYAGALLSLTKGLSHKSPSTDQIPTDLEKESPLNAKSAVFPSKTKMRSDDKNNNNAIVTPKRELPERKYKRRLFVGEADFSYTKAVLNKHTDDKPGLGKAITATEYCKEDKLGKYPDFKGNQEEIMPQGVDVVFGVDASQLLEDKAITSRSAKGRYQRIHFNFPFVDGDALGKGKTATMLHGFFSSASKLQETDDRVHVSLPIHSPTSQHPEKDIYVEGNRYAIYTASSEAGYQLYKKRWFQNAKKNQDRYGSHGYKHVQTLGGSRVSGTTADVTDNSREYIFVKTDKSVDEIEASVPPRISDTYPDLKTLPLCHTDTDSSSYDDTDLDNSRKNTKEVVSDDGTATIDSATKKFHI